MSEHGKARPSVTINAPTLDELEQMGIPRDALLCGFVVHLPDSDEFLALSNESDSVSAKSWVKTPERAYHYGHPEDARDAIRGYDKAKAIVCAVFDIDDRLAFWEME